MSIEDVVAVVESANSLLSLTHIGVHYISVLVRPLRVLTQLETLNSACLLKLTPKFVFGHAQRHVLHENVSSHSLLDVECHGV